MTIVYSTLHSACILCSTPKINPSDWSGALFTAVFPHPSLFPLSSPLKHVHSFTSIISSPTTHPRIVPPLPFPPLPSSLNPNHLTNTPPSASILPSLPPAIYISPHPHHPSLWTGVLFIRDTSTPYESLIARFTLSFPATYPEGAPPVLTFQTDIFHPLIVPLTTYTSSATDEGVSSGDVRVGPGEFSFRRGGPTQAEDSGTEEPRSLTLLNHVLSTFTTPSLLDDLPLAYAANASAWHAWRSYRGLSPSPLDHTPSDPDRGRSPTSSPSLDGARKPTHQTPSTWNWDGVFESRVRFNVESSITESTLFGAQGNLRGGFGSSSMGAGSMGTSTGGVGQGQIRFEKLDGQKLREIREGVREGRVGV